MGINLSDIRRAVQFKISDHIILLELLQRLGCRGRNVFSLVVALIFVDP